MDLKRIWQTNLLKLTLLWIVLAIIIKPGWFYFLAGIIVWLLIVFLSAPGVFWNYAALFSFNPSIMERNLKRAIAAKPVIFHPYLALGLIYARHNKCEKAIPLLEQAVTYSSGRNKLQNQLWLSEAYRAGGANQKAVSIMEYLLNQGVKSIRLYMNLALAYLSQNSLHQALEYAQKARSMDLTATEPVLIRAKVYFNMGEYQLAKDDYLWVVEHLKWPVESLYWLGRAEFELKEIDAAVDHLQTALTRIIDDPLLSDITKEEAEKWLNRARDAQKFEAF